MTHNFPKSDRELGLDRPVTRRDFVCGLATAALAEACRTAPNTSRPGGDAVGAAASDPFAVGDGWYGPGGVGDYAASHGNTPEVMRSAHAIRAGRFEAPPPGVQDTGEVYDLVIVGGGFAGLSAAHHFHRLRPNGRSLILDNHPIFGGEAKRNDFVVDGIRISGPQGSNDFVVRPPTGTPDDYFTTFGIPRDFQYEEPTGAAAGMRIPTDNFGFLHWQSERFDVGHHFAGTGWVRDVWGSGLHRTPWSPEERAAFTWARANDAANHGPDPLGPWLDTMTVREYYDQVLALPPAVAAYIDPLLASIIGLGTDVISAWWGRYFSLPGFAPTTTRTDTTYHSFPGGNAGLARYFLKHLVPEAITGSHDIGDVVHGPVRFDRLDHRGQPVRVRLRATVVRVEHEGALERSERVRVTYTVRGQPFQLHARRVVMASGGWINRHIVRELPDRHREAYESYGHSPVLVANVALRNWRFLTRLGVAAAIWSGGFGFSCNIRRPMVLGNSTGSFDPDRPAVLTFYVPLFKPGLPLRAQGAAARGELLETPFADYERQIRLQLNTLFASGGFDAARDVAGIILNRWGHAYANPGPGFAFGQRGEPSPSDILRQPFGRIAIGHSELHGHQNWTGAASEGRRAVENLLSS